MLCVVSHLMSWPASTSPSWGRQALAKVRYSMCWDVSIGQPAASYLLAGDDVAKINDYQLSRIRGRRIGFVFQSYNLLQQLNVLENIKVPLQYQGLIGKDANAKCRELAEMVGLGTDSITDRPNCPVDNNNGWRSLEAWSTIRTSFLPMKPRETWIPKPPTKS